jgi:orotate phosphoribosyltransferase
LVEAAKVVQEFGAKVLLLLAVVDRGGTAAAMAQKEGWDFDALFSAPDLGFDYEGV